MKTVEQIKQDLESEFNDGSYRSKLNIEIENSIREDKPALKIKITEMYNKPLFKKYNGNLLKFFNAIQLVIGCDNLDIRDEINDGGCETCDYGSEYGWEFWAWDDVKEEKI